MRLALAALLLSAACAGPRVDTSQRTADRRFLHHGMSEEAVVEAWGKPDSAVLLNEGGRVKKVWEFDRIYPQREGVAYFPRSVFALTFSDGKLERWLEKQR